MTATDTPEVTGPNPGPGERAPIAVWRLAWRASQHKARYFWIGLLFFVGFFTLPAVFGYVLSRAFTGLEDGDSARVYLLAGVLLVIEMVRMAFLHYGAIWFVQSWEFIRSLLRGNMLTAQLASGGPDAGTPVASAGEAVTRFRDDTEDVASFVDSWIDVTGGIVFTVVALSVLFTVDVTATSVLLLPMIVVALVTSRLGQRLQEVHRLDRRATAAVTGLLGDVMGAATTIKVNGANATVLSRLSVTMDRRRTTAVRARVYDQAIRSFGQSMADVGLGLVILVAVGPLRRGEFGVAEIVLYLSYAGWLGFLPRMIGLMLARRQQSSVAFAEMSRLVADRDPAQTALHRPFAFEKPPDPASRAGRIGPREPLERLEVESLSARFAGGGVFDVSFALDRGSFTVVTGPIGSGKSTLLRALLGLVDGDDGGVRVRWNGELVADRAAFFVPPQAAYLGQVPQLLSDSLADNVLLGTPDDGALDEALRLAAVDGDVARMADGVATMIGPRGLRLSGGQRQRVATARALVTRPELLVVDDVSSALDVETELRLWTNLAEAGTTVLAVSHRQVARDRADQVLELRDGRLV